MNFEFFKKHKFDLIIILSIEFGTIIFSMAMTMNA